MRSGLADDSREISRLVGALVVVGAEITGSDLTAVVLSGIFQDLWRIVTMN